MNAPSSPSVDLKALPGQYDPWLLFIALALLAIGVVMVASSSVAQTSEPAYYLKRHVVFVAVGIVMAALVMRLELKWLEKHNQGLLLTCLLLLTLVFIPGLGQTVNKATRWVNLGFTRFQPVEAVKILYLFWLSSYLVRFRDQVSADWIAMLKPVGVALLLMALLLKQPDYGSAALLLSITVGLLILGGGHLQRMLWLVLSLLPFLVVLAILEPYRLARITSFRNPWQDPFDSGYQLSNALMAIGRGEYFGVGLGQSIQKLGYLPEAHTDFIFSILAEETGFVGVCVVIALYAALVTRAFWLGLRCVQMRRHFSGYLALGLGLWLGLQSVVSIGVNLGLLPTKGLTLPLISYGGSSVAMTCVAMGVLLRVSYEYSRALNRRQLSHNMHVSPTPTTSPALHINNINTIKPVSAPITVPVSAPDRRGLRQRIEPTLGGSA